MIKDIFKLKKDSWHMKLMKEIWGYTHRDFSHMCPYFWLSVFNILIAIPVLFAKYVIRKPLITVADKIEAYFDRKTEEYNRRLWADLLANPEKVDRIAAKDLSRSCNEKYRRFVNSFLAYKDHNLYMMIHRKRGELNDKAWEETQRRCREMEEREAAKPYVPTTNKQKINLNLKWVKPIARVFLYVLAAATVLVALYFIWKLGAFLTTVKAASWLKVGKIVGLGLLILLAVATVVLGSGYAIKHCKMSCKTRAKLARPFNWLGDKIISLLAAIGDGVSFLVQMFKDNCPAIKWED